MEFEDVSNSENVEEFNKNVREYLEERSSLSKEERRSHYWALFYSWRDSIFR